MKLSRVHSFPWQGCEKSNVIEEFGHFCLLILLVSGRCMLNEALAVNDLTANGWSTSER